MGWQQGSSTGLRLCALTLAFALPTAGLLGCGGDDAGGKQANGGAGGGASGGATSGGATSEGGGSPQQVAGSAGKGGNTTAGQGGGPTGPAVPRVENTDGSSVLDTPGSALAAGKKCPKDEVFCNGMCVATEQQAVGNCTVLKLGLGQTRDLAVTADALYYTAANQEILKLDLAKGTHTSLVRGLTFVQALSVDGDWLYFSTETPDSFFEFDARRVGLSGGDVTVISPQQLSPIEVILPLPDSLLLGVGDFDYDLLTLPKAGGQASPFGAITGATTPVLGSDKLYYRTRDGLCGTSISAPMPDQALNSEFTNARIILEGNYLYYTLDDNYKRQPIGGGAAEVVQPLVDTLIVGRSSTHVILIQEDATDSAVTHLLAMPIAGGPPEQLLDIESSELQDVAANATDLYVAVGMSAAGAILRVPLPG